MCCIHTHGIGGWRTAMMADPRRCAHCMYMQRRVCFLFHRGDSNVFMVFPCMHAAKRAARATSCRGGGGGAAPCRVAARLQGATAYGGLVRRISRQVPRRPIEYRFRATTEAGEEQQKRKAPAESLRQFQYTACECFFQNNQRRTPLSHLLWYGQPTERCMSLFSTWLHGVGTGRDCRVFSAAPFSCQLRD